MLIDFSVSNFLSFKNKVKIDFTADSIKEYKEQNTFLPHPQLNFTLLKSIGFFGNNASGKSNILKALAFMKDFVLNSSKETQSNESIPVTNFLLSTETESAMSSFEIRFLIDGFTYKYGFEVNKNKVRSEWLFVTQKIKEEPLFFRIDNEFRIDKRFKSEAKGNIEMLTGVTRSNALFLSVLSQFNGEISSSITKWFNKIIVIIDEEIGELIEETAPMFSNSTFKKQLSQIIEKAGLGFKSIEAEISLMAKKSNFSRRFISNIYATELNNNYKIKTSHEKFNEESKWVDNVFFDLDKQESIGTQKFIGLLGPILLALNEQRIIIIDELDSRLHTNLVAQIVSIFNSRFNNPNGAQLIFSSHNTNLLRKNLRRDQIALLEKDSLGSSTIQTINQLKSKVRSDASFEKDYLNGEYVKIPLINSQLTLFH